MTHTEKIKISYSLAIISAIVVLVVSTILLINYWQISHNDPLENEALKVLVEKTFQNPEDQQLKESVRNLDLMARKAFFTSKWQIKMGTYILLIAAILFIGSLRIYYSAIEKLPLPEKNTRNDYLINKLNRKWILIVAIVFVLLAFAAGYLSRSYIKDFSLQTTNQLVEPSETLEDVPIIEVVEITMDSVISVETDTALITEENTTVISIDSNVTIEKKDSIVEQSIAPYPTSKEIESNFASFRGPWGNSISKHNNIPTSWDGVNGKNILWKTAIPKHGYNSPIIWDDKIFIAGGDKTSRVVYCIDRKTGAIIWQKEVKNVPGSSTKLPNTTDDTGLSAASVTTDGRRVYAIFANGDLITFDMDGNQLWSKSLGIPDNHYGHSSSLISWQGKLFVQYDSNRGGKLYAFNVLTGDIVWQVVRKCKISWASPTIAVINGKRQLILASNPIIAGYSLANGKELWSVDCMYGEVGPSPAYGSGLIFAANEYAKLVAIDPADNYKIKWEDDEYLPEVSSPVVYKDLLFIATSYGVLACYDAKEGSKLWEKEYKSGFYSSPMIVDGKLYAIDMAGVTHIIAPGREFKLISEPKLGEKIVTTPAFTDGHIFIRSDKYLYCIGK